MAAGKTPEPTRAVTLRSTGGLARSLLMRDCKVCAAFDPDAVAADFEPPFIAFDALWDTGATATVVTQNVVDRCGLQPMGQERVRHGGGEDICDVYYLSVELPGAFRIKNVRVTKLKVAGADLLIGMDIITLGDFSVTNENGSTVFSFRTPSQHTVDFVKDPRQHGSNRGALLRMGFQHGARKHK